MRKLALIVGFVVAAVVGSAVPAAACEDHGKPKIYFANGGKPRQEAYWAKSYNYADVIVCAAKGDRAQAVYRISRLQKKYRKLGYYWGGRAPKWDKACNAKK